MSTTLRDALAELVACRDESPFNYRSTSAVNTDGKAEVEHYRREHKAWAAARAALAQSDAQAALHEGDVLAAGSPALVERAADSMSPYLVSLVAQIAAAQARVAAMHAENLCRMAVGNSPAYGEDAFNAQADALDHLAIAARNWQE